MLGLCAIILVGSALLLMQCLAVVQFLPQDKVVEFARLSPVELLRETQKAIGDSRLADLHKQLIQENVKCNVSTRVSKLCRRQHSLEHLVHLAAHHVMTTFLWGLGGWALQDRVAPPLIPSLFLPRTA